MSAGTYLAGAFAKNLPALLALKADPGLLAKTAAKHNIPTTWADEYLDRAIAAKRAGK